MLSWFGAWTRNCRSTRSGARSAAGSDTVVRTRLVVNGPNRRHDDPSRRQRVFGCLTARLVCRSDGDDVDEVCQS